MALIKYKPENRRLENPLFADFFDRFFNDGSASPTTTDSKSFFRPAVDIIEDEKSFELSLAVPGMRKQDFSIDLDKDKITIRGERKIEEEKKERSFHTLQTQYGSFERSFYLPEAVDREKIDASYRDGILSLVIPKDEKKQDKKRISVK